jgi:hypothetical protein
MSILLAGTITITAPAGIDGLGGTAVLNNSADTTNYVGDLWEVSGLGGASVRSSLDPLVEDHGAVFGSFYYGPRSFTLKPRMKRSTTYALSDARYDKLCRAWDAMHSDGTITWPDTDGVTKRLSFRREQSPSDPDAEGYVLLAGIAADPLIYNNTPQTGSSPKTNAGNASSYPTFTLTPTGGDVVLTNTTAGLGSPAVTLTEGAVGVGVSTGSAVTVDFAAKTVTQGGTRKDYAVQFPSSLWWAIAPGANTWSVTNASSVSISFRDAWKSA